MFLYICSRPVSLLCYKAHEGRELILPSSLHSSTPSTFIKLQLHAWHPRLSWAQDQVPVFRRLGAGRWREILSNNVEGVLGPQSGVGGWVERVGGPPAEEEPPRLQRGARVGGKEVRDGTGVGMAVQVHQGLRGQGEPPSPAQRSTGIC